MPVVTRVRRVQAPGGEHQHLSGVCTGDGVYYSRYDVAKAIDAGEEWWSERDGVRMRIHKVQFCPFPGCLTFPYLAAGLDPNPAAELEDLPTC